MYNEGAWRLGEWSEYDKRRSKDFITAIEKNYRSEGTIGSLEACCWMKGKKIRILTTWGANQQNNVDDIVITIKEHPSETIVFHNEDGNPARANIKQALGYFKDGDGRWKFLCS
ncbi:hypothetical protein Tco_0843877 [Tanacetum coccineum]